jgi:hypothetical protein
MLTFLSAGIPLSQLIKEAPDKAFVAHAVPATNPLMVLLTLGLVCLLAAWVLKQSGVKQWLLAQKNGANPAEPGSIFKRFFSRLKAAEPSTRIVHDSDNLCLLSQLTLPTPIAGGMTTLYWVKVGQRCLLLSFNPAAGMACLDAQPIDVAMTAKLPDEAGLAEGVTAPLAPQAEASFVVAPLPPEGLVLQPQPVRSYGSDYVVLADYEADY